MDNIKPYNPKFSKVRPITVAIHPNLKHELEIRKEIIEKELGRKTHGGITCFSEMAALELWALRQSGKKIMSEILKLSKNEESLDKYIHKFKINGVEQPFIPFWIFKKIYIFSSVLNLKKDEKNIKMEVHKIRGLKKNDIKYWW